MMIFKKLDCKNMICLIVIIMLAFGLFGIEKITRTYVHNPELQVSTNENVQIQTSFDDKPLLYKNIEEGYQIKFPESWRGWFDIDKDEYSNFIRIKFIGKSKTGSIATKNVFNCGLPMFYIVSEKELNSTPMLDNIRKIGDIDGISYYYATGTGSDITALVTIADENSAIRKIADYVVDEEELKLAESDWKQVEKMYADIDEILSSFSPIQKTQGDGSTVSK